MAGLLPEALAERPGLAPRLWSAGRGLPAVEPVPYAEIGDGGPGLRRCLEQLQRDGFVVVEGAPTDDASARRTEEHTSELQSLMRTSYAVFCLNKHIV